MARPTRVIVIGAGWSGLVAARTYLQIAEALGRRIDLTILDDGPDPGGVWSTSRLYPGLTANSPNGLYEYSHMTMVDEEHRLCELLPGTRVHEYLEAYARRFGIVGMIRFGRKVVMCRRKGGGVGEGWEVRTEEGEVWECEKLIVAAGLYGKPRVPEIKREEFEGVSVHSRELGRMQRRLREDAAVKNVVVVGGCKSAVEAVSLFLPHLNPDRKYTVSWVVRPSEQGVPMVVQDTHKEGNIVAINNTRLFGLLSPSVFWTSGFWYTLLHSGKWWVGTVLLNFLWVWLSWVVKRAARYRSSENGRRIEPRGRTLFYDVSFVSLLPKKSPFLKYLHEDDDEVLKVHRVTPRELRGREMAVVDVGGKMSTLACDVVIWCTGWVPSVDFFEREEAERLGVPVAVAEEKVKTTTEQAADSLPTSMLKPAQEHAVRLSEAAKQAEKKVIQMFPSLGTEARRGYPPGWTPFRLYRQIIPTRSLETNDRSIAFAGLVSNAQTAMCCELTSLWAVAYMEGLLPQASLPSQKQAEENVELVSAWMRRRFGVRGMRDPEIVLEIQGFFDVLCRDLGVEWQRKKKGRKGGWVTAGRAEIKEYTTPYLAEDYKGVIEEFLVNNGHL